MSNMYLYMSAAGPIATEFELPKRNPNSGWCNAVTHSVVRSNRWQMTLLHSDANTTVPLWSRMKFWHWSLCCGPKMKKLSNQQITSDPTGPSHKKERNRIAFDKFLSQMILSNIWPHPVLIYHSWFQSFKVECRFRHKSDHIDHIDHIGCGAL